MHEWLKDAAENLRRHADTGIVNFETDGARSPVRHVGDADPDRSFSGEFDRIADQVGQDLPQPVRVPADRGRDIVLDDDGESELFSPGRFREDLQHARDHRVELEVDRLDVQHPGLDLRRVEDVVDDGQQRVAAAPNAIDIGLLGRVQGVSFNRLASPMTPFIGVRIS